MCASALSYYEKIKGKFEEKYSISSEEFMTKFENGELGDDQDFFDWYAYNRLAR